MCLWVSLFDTICVYMSLVLSKCTNKSNQPREEQEEQYKSEVIINAKGKQLKN